MAVRSQDRSHFLRKRMERAFWIILACYLALVARLVYLQGVQGPILRREAMELRAQKQQIAAHRGTICDSDGRPLAVSLYSGTVGFDPKTVLPDPKDAKKTARMEAQLHSSIGRVAGLLRLAPDALAETIRQARHDFDPEHPKRFFPIQKGIPLEVAQAIRGAHPRMIGFGVQDGSKRVYSEGENAAQVVGFLGSEGVGVAGLEKACRHWLDGHAGYSIAETDVRGREIPDTQQRELPVKDGMDVRTTLDANAQHIVTEEIQQIVQKHHPKGISALVLDPYTGDVKALVSYPTYDPEKRQTLTGEALAERCATRLYEPGSTLKAMTIAAALDEGDISLGSGYFCANSFQVGKKHIHCAHGERHGWENLTDVMRHSCNVAAAQIGLQMGPKKLFAADKKFGLFEKLNVGLPAAQKGVLSFDRNEKVYSAPKAARVAFGQSIATTPLHVALAYSALANGGTLMEPRLLQSVTDGEGKVRHKWEPKAVRRVLKPETCAQIRSMLRAVVSNGTGKPAAIPGYQIAGKTGTTQKYQPGKYVGSFIGFLPASPTVKPRAVILVAVDEPSGEAHYGGDVAAPTFKAIASRLMAYWRVPEDDPNATQAEEAAYHLKHPGH